MGILNATIMTRCWQMAPSSDRIMQDIQALPMVLDKIIAAKGCVVQDEYLRSGRRFRRADDKGDCKLKPRLSQRINTSTIKAEHMTQQCHSDCAEALNIIKEVEPALLPEFVDAINDLMHDFELVALTEDENDDDAGIVVL